MIPSILKNRKGSVFGNIQNEVWGFALMIIFVGLAAYVVGVLDSSSISTGATADVLGNASTAFVNFAGLTPVQGTLLAIIAVIAIVFLVRKKTGSMGGS